MEAEPYDQYEIVRDPKPEDVGTIKVYVTIPPPGSFSEPSPRRFLFSLQHDQSISDCASGLSDLKDLLIEAGFTNQYADDIKTRFTRRFSSFFSSDFFKADAASNVYLLIRVIRPQIDDVIQASFNEANNNIRFRPASKVMVGSLSRKVYDTEDKVLSSDSTRCVICLEEFKNRERLVILPCGHGFDERCIVDWFQTSHVCPLCRFELPCEDG